jgi:hypothetical protein
MGGAAHGVDDDAKSGQGPGGPGAGQDWV